MSYRCHTPILLLLFNRPKHAEAVIQQLRKVQPATLYVHCDGARADVSGEAEKVAMVRLALEKIDWPCEIKTLFREQNAGLRVGVYGALNWFFESEAQGIVIEDDCMPDPSFFPFCEAMLDRYAQEEKVMHIGGSNVAEKLSRQLPSSYFFSQFSFVWGWATWRRSWAKMSIDLEGFESFVAEHRIKTLTSNPFAQAYMLDKFRATKARENNSWAYAWAYSVMINNGLSIVPSINLVQNTGIGEAEATHTKSVNNLAQLKASSMAFPLKHPATLDRPKGLDQEIFYVAQKSRIRLTLWFLLQKFGLR